MTKRKASVRKRKRPKFETFSIRVVSLIVLLSVALFLLSLNNGYKAFEDELPKEGSRESFTLVSLEAFEYVNEYRGLEGKESLRFSNKAFSVANDINNRKEINSEEFLGISDRTVFVNKNLGVENATSNYVGIYEVGGLGIEEFKSQFDEVYFVKNVVNSDKYDYGAVACSMEYCSLVLFKLPLGSILVE